MRCSYCGHDGGGAKFCGECGAARTDDAARDPSERRQLTVLFCDLVGSTELSGRLDPEEWQDVVRAYQDAAAAVVAKHHGHVAQYLGDGVLVYFGYPSARDDDAERAVRAGLGIVETLAAVNAGLGSDRQLVVRVGIHTGPVVVGPVGTADRRETLALGEATNVAARVQGLAQPDTVVMSAATQRLVSGIFIVEELGPQTLKGVADPVVCHRVLRPSGMRSRLELAAGRLTRFVGRAAELDVLRDRWRRAARGEGHTVLVVGEAGVGKSRLVWEMRERLVSEPHTWLECRATPYAQGTPFAPVIELVTKGLSFLSGDSLADEIAKLEHGLAPLDHPVAETAPILARLLGLPVADRYALPELGPDVERQRTLEILVDWILALAAVQPVVLFVEDLHWCDASSLELFGRIIESNATAPVLLVGTARPEFVPPWPARSTSSIVHVERLGTDDAREIVAALGGFLPEEAVATLVTRADGVPLYLEELTKVLAEPGAARRPDAIPATLADSLMARLDRLSAAKEVAQRAAVLGREFPYALLATIAGLDEPALRYGIARLVDAEILFASGEPPTSTYSFKHALVQEAAYESLLKRVRQQLHARVCDVLAAERDAVAPEILAHHAERGGRFEQAIRHLERAGEQAQERSAHAEAVRHFEKAIALLATQVESVARDTHEAELRLTLAASFVASRGFAHADTREAFARAATLAGHVGSERIAHRARIGTSIGLHTSGQIAPAHALALEVLAAPAANDDDTRIVVASQQVAVAEFYLGRFASALVHLERGWAVYDPARHGVLVRELGTEYGVATLVYIAWVLAHLGRFDGAIAFAAKAVACAERSQHPFSTCFALAYECGIRVFVRDFRGACERAADAIALADRFRFPLWSGIARFLDGFARVMAGDGGGLAEMLDGLSRAGQTGNQSGASAMMGQLADAQCRLGMLEDAQASLAAATAMATLMGERFWEAELHVTDGELAHAAGATLVDVLARFDSARTVARELGDLRSELRAALATARVLRDASHLVEAHAALDPVYARFTEGFDTPMLTDAKVMLREVGAA